MKIGMNCVFVNNPIEAFKIYTQMLGFVKVLYMYEGPLAILTSTNNPNGTALLLEPNGVEFA
ncbi:MAG: hypothetical protein JEZ03_16335 [Bacteroidales bacterium]|nr:hypothetical protein [Bacteroidales bacterium]